MEEEVQAKPANNISSAVCELNLLQRNDDTSGPSSSSIAVGTGVRGFRSIPMPASSLPSEGLYTFNSHSVAKLQMNLNPRYISKITNSPRKVIDTSLRMRPYFIPERSRTKSENNVDRPPEISTDVFTITNTNSNSSMMETCEGYLIADGASTASGPASTNPAGVATNFLGAFGTNALGGSVGNAGLLGPRQPHRATSHPTLNQWKKSRSLEDVRAENLDGSLPSHEMEFVSSRIQKLKVQE